MMAAEAPPEERRRDEAFAALNAAQALRMARLPLSVKLRWLEQAHHQVLWLQGQRAEPYHPPPDDDAPPDGRAG